MSDIFKKEGGREVKRGTLARNIDTRTNYKHGQKRGEGAIIDTLNKTVALTKGLHKEVDADQGTKSSVADIGKCQGVARKTTYGQRDEHNRGTDGHIGNSN